MQEDTLELLKECNAGCKSATNSMEQMKKFIRDEAFGRLIEEYDRKHVALGDECHSQLEALGYSEQDPSPMGKLMAKTGIGMKMAMDPGTEHIAELMVDGCGMGIKSISKVMNRHPDAAPESRRLAKQIVETEQSFMAGLLGYL